MKTLILAGGYGTRIRDVADDIPKPMIPIGNTPVLWHIMNWYARYKYREFVLCLGYRSDVIKNYFLQHKTRISDFTLNLKDGSVKEHAFFNTEFDWKITFAETGLNALTGARVKRASKYIEGDDYFMLTYGDGVGDIDIDALASFHKAHGKHITVTGAHPPGRFGELSIEGDQVKGFNEKPQTTEGWISAGYFVCSKEVLNYLTDNEDLIFEREPLERLAAEGQMMVYKHQGFWHPMDTSRDHQLLNGLWNSNKAPWK